METAYEHKAASMSPASRIQTLQADDSSLLTTALSSAQSLRALIGLKLAPLGLAAGQDRLLLALEVHDRMSVSALADTLNVRPSTVSKTMDRLVKRGFTVRSHDNFDARRTNVELTDDGRAMCRKLRLLCEAVENELQSDLSAEDTRRMMEGLTLFNEAVGKRLHRMR